MLCFFSVVSFLVDLCTKKNRLLCNITLSFSVSLSLLFFFIVVRPIVYEDNVNVNVNGICINAHISNVPLLPL